MTDNTRPEGFAPITTRAAENGIYVSAMLCVLLAVFGLATSSAIASLLFWCGALAFPIMVYRLLGRSLHRSEGTMPFSEIWAEGIVTFFLGSLIPALMCYGALRFVFPDFIAGQFDSAIEAFNSLNTPQADELATLLENIRSKAGLPTPTDIVANFLSMNFVFGTVFSLFAASLLSIKRNLRKSAGKA